MIKRLAKDEAVQPPDWVTEDWIKYWDSLGFDLCFLPAQDFLNNSFPDDWLDRPNDFFSRLIETGQLPRSAAQLTGHWLLVDGRDKPKKRRRWISSDEAKFFEKIKLPLGHFLRQQKTKQVYPQEFLNYSFKALGATSRFCLTPGEIEKIREVVAELLYLPTEKVRLPNFVEYNCLGNLFFPQWASTATWEWLSDRAGDKQLAAGAGSVSSLGLDPIDYWSTILGFRFVVEI
ncbi:MAG: hypothetical protein V1664_04045 [Candidatus Uhrbacteria bacterium]